MRNLLRAFLLFVVLRSTEAAVLRIVPGPFESGKVYVECWFDGRKENCFLDTGSAITLVPQDFSPAPALGTFRFKSASRRTTEADLIQMGSIRLDERIFRDVRVGRMPGNVAAQETSIGMDILDHQSFSLEFRDSPALRLQPPPPRETFQSMRIMKHGLIMIPVRLGETPSAALVDTGAGLTAVDSAFVQAHPEVFRSLGRKMKGTDGAGHTISFQVYRAKALTVGSRTFRNVHVVATDLSLLREDGESDLHVILGFNIIRKTDWYFDPQNKVWGVRR